MVPAPDVCRPYYCDHPAAPECLSRFPLASMSGGNQAWTLPPPRAESPRSAAEAASDETDGDLPVPQLKLACGPSSLCTRHLWIHLGQCGPKPRAHYLPRSLCPPGLQSRALPSLEICEDAQEPGGVAILLTETVSPPPLKAITRGPGLWLRQSGLALAVRAGRGEGRLR